MTEHLTVFFWFQRDDGDDDEEDEEEKRRKERQAPGGGAEGAAAVIQGQVYVNLSPPLLGRGPVDGRASSGTRPRSRSYDRDLDKSPPPRLGSLERMMSCPVRLSEGAAPAPPPPPPRVTSFAEIARSKRRNGGAAGGSPPTKAAADPFSSTYSAHSHSPVDFSPIPERRVETDGVPPVPFTRCYSQGSTERHLEGAREPRAKAEGA